MAPAYRCDSRDSTVSPSPGATLAVGGGKRVRRRDGIGLPPDFDLLGVPDTDIRYSRDPARHLGFIRFTLRRWRLRGHLLDFEPDELLSIAFIETADLLANKYDPTRATVTSFLSSYLFGRVQYAALRGKGMRRRANRWHRPVDQSGRPTNDHRPRPRAEGGVYSKRVTGVEPATFRPVTSSWKNGSRAAKSAFPCRNQVAIVASVAL